MVRQAEHFERTSERTSGVKTSNWTSLVREREGIGEEDDGVHTFKTLLCEIKRRSRRNDSH